MNHFARTKESTCAVTAITTSLIIASVFSKASCDICDGAVNIFCLDQGSLCSGIIGSISNFRDWNQKYFFFFELNLSIGMLDDQLLRKS
jgi:hypothetical protein